MKFYKFRYAKIFFFIFILLLSSIFFAIMLGEVVIRLYSRTGYVTPEILSKRQLPYSPSIFARHVFTPKEIVVQLSDGRRYKINNMGYRGPNFSLNKPENKIRIIFYGGSAVFDNRASEEEDWPRLVEQFLHEKGLQHVEILNAGIPGHASFDSLGRLFSEGHTFNPDYVVLYNAWNAIKYFRHKKPLLRLFFPYHKDRDPRLYYQGKIDQILCEFSQLYVRLRYFYYNLKLNIGSEGTKPRGTYSSTISESALRQYRLNIEMFVDCARNINSHPILMTQARLVSPTNTGEQRKRIEYDFQLLTHDALFQAFIATDKIIHEVAKNKNVSLIDSSRIFSGVDELFYDHVHLNKKGAKELSEYVGERIFRILKKYSFDIHSGGTYETQSDDT